MYFSVDVVSMAQHVNTSLLRLVHQLTTVVDNITKTNAEIKRQKRKEARIYKKTHRCWQLSYPAENSVF